MALVSCASSSNKTDEIDKLLFDVNTMVPVEKTLTFDDGTRLAYRSYEKIYYVSNVADPAYQYLNMYVPETAYTDNAKTPIFLKNNVGGYMAGNVTEPSANDVTGRALREGYIVVVPGVRGSNSAVNQEGEPLAVSGMGMMRGAGGRPPVEGGAPPDDGGAGVAGRPPQSATSPVNDPNYVYTGKAPAGLLDLKAAVRYLRHNDAAMPGNAELIISDGTSAGGAMSALLGATANNPVYEPYLREMGAADERDDIFAAICFCPITDLDHADMAYEWLYSGTNTEARALSPEQTAISNELAALFPAYIDGLGLVTAEGTKLGSANYYDYIKSFLLSSAQKAYVEGINFPEETGVMLNAGGTAVEDINLETYLNYLAGKTRLKAPPAFDTLGVLGQAASAENNVFGDASGNAANFTGYSLQKSAGNPSAELSAGLNERVYMMNPLAFIGDGVSNPAPYWYIRHGAADRDTSFVVPVTLYTKLVNSGYDVNFTMPWAVGHSGDYNLDEVFAWVNEVVKKAK
jgi:hypothetical protein